MNYLRDVTKYRPSANLQMIDQWDVFLLRRISTGWVNRQEPHEVVQR